MLLALLVGCYDRVTLDYTVDLEARTVAAALHYWNAWPDTVKCEDVDAATCAANVHDLLVRESADLVAKGATVHESGATIRDGELDLVYVYDAPFSAVNEEGFAFEVVQTASWCPFSRPKERVALYTEVDADEVGGMEMTVKGRWRRVVRTGDKVRTAWIFSGRKAKVHIGAVSDEGTAAGAWTTKIPGLREALEKEGIWLGPPA